MIRQIDQVKDFNEAFGIPVNSRPTLLDKDLCELNHRLLKEENDEYLEACENGDLVEIADALGDQLYIVVGNILKHGLQDAIIPVFDEIHLSNMSKLENGEVLRREDGKVLKGSHYFPPRIAEIINKIYNAEDY